MSKEDTTILKAITACKTAIERKIDEVSKLLGNELETLKVKLQILEEQYKVQDVGKTIEKKRQPKKTAPKKTTPAAAKKVEEDVKIDENIEKDDEKSEPEDSEDEQVPKKMAPWFVEKYVENKEEFLEAIKISDVVIKNIVKQAKTNPKYKSSDEQEQFNIEALLLYKHMSATKDKIAKEKITSLYEKYKTEFSKGVEKAKTPKEPVPVKKLAEKKPAPKEKLKIEDDSDDQDVNSGNDDEKDEDEKDEDEKDDEKDEDEKDEEKDDEEKDEEKDDEEKVVPKPKKVVKKTQKEDDEDSDAPKKAPPKKKGRPKKETTVKKTQKSDTDDDD